MRPQHACLWLVIDDYTMVRAKRQLLRCRFRLQYQIIPFSVLLRQNYRYRVVGTQPNLDHEKIIFDIIMN